MRVLSCERRTDRTRVSWPRQKSHRLFLLSQTSFLCQQPLTNWVTHKIVKRPHGTSICSGEAQRADPSTSRALSRCRNSFVTAIVTSLRHFQPNCGVWDSIFLRRMIISTFAIISVQRMLVTHGRMFFCLHG